METQAAMDVAETERAGLVEATGLTAEAQRQAALYPALAGIRQQEIATGGRLGEAELAAETGQLAAYLQALSGVEAASFMPEAQLEIAQLTAPLEYAGIMGRAGIEAEAAEEIARQRATADVRAAELASQATLGAARFPAMADIIQAQIEDARRRESLAQVLAAIQGMPTFGGGFAGPRGVTTDYGAGYTV
jgi:hypothetical protein